MFDEIYEKLYEANEMLAESNLDNHHKKVLEKDVILPFIETYNKKFFNVYREIEMLENVLQNCKNQTSYEKFRSVENLRHNVEQFYAMFLNKSFDNVVNVVCQNLSQLTNRFTLETFHQLLKELNIYEQLSKKIRSAPTNRRDATIRVYQRLVINFSTNSSYSCLPVQCPAWLSLQH